MRRATTAMSNPGREKSASTTNSRIPRAKPVVATNVKTKDGSTSRDRALGGKSKSPAKSTSIPSAVDVRTSGSSRSSASASQRAPKHHLQPRKDKKGSGSKENLPQGTPSCKPSKSAMSYMELKKSHQSLLAEKESLEQSSKEKESQQQAVIHQLAEEIKLYKEQNTALKEEISSCQERINERNQQLGVLQQHLEEIKFENERMAAILGRARVDPVTGEQIELAVKQQDEEQAMEVELEAHERKVDGFLSTLEATLGDLQKQKEHILGMNHVVI